jgi:hypothetical protein
VFFFPISNGYINLDAIARSEDGDTPGKDSLQLTMCGGVTVSLFGDDATLIRTKLADIAKDFAKAEKEHRESDQWRGEDDEE